MRMLVESLKRLFANGNVTEVKLAQMAAVGTITEEEKAYIMAGIEKGA